MVVLSSKKKPSSPALKKAAAKKGRPAAPPEPAVPAAPPPAAAPPASKGRPPGGGIPPVGDQLGPRLRAEFAELQKSEGRLLRALAKPETAQAFVADPLGTFTALRIAVPPIIKQRLKAAPVTGDAPNLQQARAFRLPNGQVVTAKVNVRFTGAPKGD
ncbi:MAG TPA: hypothetical protein VKD67_07935 [Acidimicrobiales bacterium]|nr:hypothetical protein [Acidimicrobiales bacterium]